MKFLNTNFEEDFIQLLNTLPLSNYQKNIIKYRFVKTVVKAEVEQFFINAAFFFLTNAIFLAGILITAFVSFDKLDWIDEDASRGIFWTVWSLGILLTLSSKLLYSFNIHKKSILGVVVLEKYYSEGWEFLSGIGKYQTDDLNERFSLFCSRIEKIKLKAVNSMPEAESTNTVNEIVSMGPQPANEKEEV